MNAFATLDFERPATRSARHPVLPATSGDALPVAQPEGATAADFLLAGLDGSAHGVAILDDVSRIIYSNSMARTTLAKAGWTMDRGLLRSGRAPECDAWNEALYQVCHRGRHQLFELSAPEGCRFAALVPVVVKGSRRAFVTLGRHELCGGIELQLFASRCGLTYAEGQVLCQLVRGLRSAEIASAHGVTLSTVLTQVAAIRGKTMSSSVRQLLSTLSRMPPLRPAAMGADH
jgi:DNA-binding CsgD family transcriptional regulator